MSVDAAYEVNRALCAGGDAPRLDWGRFTACRPYAGIRAHAAGPCAKRRSPLRTILRQDENRLIDREQVLRIRPPSASPARRAPLNRAPMPSARSTTARPATRTRADPAATAMSTGARAVGAQAHRSARQRAPARSPRFVAGDLAPRRLRRRSTCPASTRPPGQRARQQSRKVDRKMRPCSREPVQRAAWRRCRTALTVTGLVCRMGERDRQ